MTFEDDAQFYEEHDDRTSSLPQSSRRPSMNAHTVPTTTNASDDPATTSSNADCWVEDYPEAAGAGATYGDCTNSFNAHYEKQKRRGESPWSPFSSYEDWQLAQWLMTAGVSQTKIDDLLALPSIAKKVKPSFHNTRSLLKLVDALPGGPEFQCKVLEITGDEKDEHGNFRTETVELIYRNPVDVAQELIENPFIGEKNSYAPHKIFRNTNRTNREYGEMATSNWWARIQVYMDTNINCLDAETSIRTNCHMARQLRL
ncbi:hypothetical protein H0H92_004752 [Tricholoma furcatifolium]|nr:hypothetical protein H0H92_004752 [Tricholoma furcatifolium]